MKHQNIFQRLILLIVTLMTLASTAHAETILENFCTAHHGQMMSTWTCPNSQVQRNGPWCKLEDDNGKDLITNGCTGAIGSYTTTFFKACVLHDFCYHNEPGSTGKQKSDCDSKFHADMMEICHQQPGDNDMCEAAADTFYWVVLGLGGPSFICSKGSATYPASINSL